MLMERCVARLASATRRNACRRALKSNRGTRKCMGGHHWTIQARCCSSGGSADVAAVLESLPLDESTGRRVVSTVRDLTQLSSALLIQSNSKVAASEVQRMSSSGASLSGDASSSQVNVPLSLALGGDSGAFECRNMFCEKLGEACLCRMALALGQLVQAEQRAVDSGSSMPVALAIEHVDLSGSGIESLPESVVSGDGPCRFLKTLEARNVRLDWKGTSRLGVNVVEQMVALADVGALPDLESVDLRGNDPPITAADLPEEFLGRDGLTVLVD